MKQDNNFLQFLLSSVAFEHVLVASDIWSSHPCRLSLLLASFGLKYILSFLPAFELKILVYMFLMYILSCLQAFRFHTADNVYN